MLCTLEILQFHFFFVVSYSSLLGLTGMQAHPLDISNTSDYTVQFEVMSKRMRQGADMKLASEKIISDSLCDATRDIVSNYIAPSRLNCKLTAPEKDM